MFYTGLDFSLRCGTLLQQIYVINQILTQGLVRKNTSTTITVAAGLPPQQLRRTEPHGPYVHEQTWTCVISLSPHSNPRRRVLLLSLFYRWGNRIRGILAQMMKLRRADLGFKTRLILSILWKWSYCPKQSIDSMQSLSNYLMAFFTELEQKNFTICMETQKTPDSKSNLEKEEWSWRNQPSWLQTILQNCSHQDSMAQAQKQKYKPMEQDRKSRDKPMHLWEPYLTKEAIIYNEEKIASSVNCAGKTGQWWVKEWN